MPQVQYLVIGYGNTLRSDDGVGYRVAESVAAWNLPQVRSLPCHQLTPELAAELADTGTVIFVDAVAIAPGAGQAIQIQRLTPQVSRLRSGHHSDPAMLLALAQTLYGVALPAYAIWVPAVNFNFGEQLSAIAQQGIKAALAVIKHIAIAEEFRIPAINNPEKDP